MRKLLLAFFMLAAFVPMLAQEHHFPTYREIQDFRQASPGAFRTGLYGFDNPAILMYNNSSEIMIQTSSDNDRQFKFDRWGFFWQFGNSSLNAITQKQYGEHITDWRYSFAFGNRSLAFGLNYGFTGGAKSAFRRSNTLGWGFLIRPNEYVSLSGSQTYALSYTDGESVVDLAIRPIKGYLLTLFADYAMFHDEKLKDGTWSAGLSWEFLDGLRVNGTYRDDKSIALGVDMSMRYFGIGATAGFNEDGDASYRSYSVKFGGPDRSFLDEFLADRHWLSLTLKGGIKYQEYKWFKNAATLSEILLNLEDAAKDPNVPGIVIDAREISGGISTMWEVRDALQNFRLNGKKVVVFLERAGIGGYYLASCADKIVLDPLGSVQVSGFALTRSYYKKLLDKLGIGFEEIRKFKYKSAYENFARDEMSEGDREQRQRFIDDWFNTIKTDIAASRGISPATFDQIVDSKITQNAKSSIANNLVDTLARWDNCKDVLKKLYPDEDASVFCTESLVSSDHEEEPIDDKWGYDAAGIALIYITGDCDMNSGINARKTAKLVRGAAKNPNIKAIVLRVDSPGGDAMASDYVADVVREFKGKKPIIVSQGAMAASGGYWLSMDADKIVSTPLTLTGSIGVISAWIYDKGLSDTLGIHAETLKTSKYSDLGQSFSLPIIPIGLPTRNLNADERKQFEDNIDDMYGDFVTRVSNGRKMTYDEVHNVAQGRVWTGKDAKDIKLVDELGSLTKAISMAKDAAGIKPDEEINIYEMPEAQLFNLSELLSGMFGVEESFSLKESELKDILFRLEHNGEAMPIVSPDYYQLVK